MPKAAPAAEDEGLPWVGQEEVAGSEESDYTASTDDEDMMKKVARLKRELAAAVAGGDSWG